MIGWEWFVWSAALIGGPLILRQQQDINSLKRKVKALTDRADFQDAMLDEPWPSENSEEEQQIEVARELCRSQGIKLSSREAILVMRRVRAEREKSKVKAKIKALEEKSGGEHGEKR